MENANRHIDRLFSAIVLFLIFKDLPEAIRISMLGGWMGSQLAFFPLLVGAAYSLYLHSKKRFSIEDRNIIVKYIFLYIGILLISLAFGLWQYPYYQEILDGPINQVDKVPKITSLLNSFGIAVDSKLVLSFWMFARPIKGLLLDVLYTFGGSYLIYCWYKRQWGKAWQLTCKAVLISVVVLFAYSSIELCYLSGSSTAGKILGTINPYIHLINERGTWWPPLLWKGQLRSVFAEPSYFGMYAAFSMPFFWHLIFKSKTVIYPLMTTIFTFLLFLTKARTAFMLHIGEIIVFSLLLILFARNKQNIKKAVIVYVCTAIAFLCSNLFIVNCMNPQPAATGKIVSEANQLAQSMESYVDSNAKSLLNPDKRSNRARYSVMEADFKIGLAHPLLGVGKGLRNAYVPDYFSESAKNDGEVKMWLANMRKQGIMKGGIPMLGEYTGRFAETGLLGLLVFLSPLIILAKKLITIMCTDGFSLEYVFFTVSLAGMVAAGIGDGINITYCYWVLLGLGYAMCFGERYLDSNKEEVK